ncbi:MAG: hypothetical protein ABSF59_21145 [Candidatus Sulfotelmatobacter sp.]|jgi:hypothetical protein
MRRVRKPRKTAILPEALRRKLDLYGLAAAGVGIAALSPSAQAEIVYTPAHEKISRYGTTIDLNHDGIGDFRIRLQEHRSSGGMFAYSLGHNRVFGEAFASELAAGYQIGPNSAKFKRGGTFSSFQVPGKAMYECAVQSGPPSCDGPWYQATPGSYVGFKFSISGEVHYGWARVKVETNSDGGFNVYLTGYAYESIANKPIVAGQTSGSDQADAQPGAPTRLPATLGLLSVGASALPAWHLSSQ